MERTVNHHSNFLAAGQEQGAIFPKTVNPEICPNTAKPKKIQKFKKYLRKYLTKYCENNRMGTASY